MLFLKRSFLKHRYVKLFSTLAEKQKDKIGNFRDFIKNVENFRSPSSSLPEAVPYVPDEQLKGGGKKVYFETYGCQMNVNDTEIARSVLLNAGYVETRDYNSADIVLLMTCAIREGAEQKIWRRIEQLKLKKMMRKKTNTEFKIGILGCMAERLKQKIIEKEPAIDLIAGPDAYRSLPQMLVTTESGQSAVNVILSLDETYADITPVRVDPNSITAFVSIMRGCDNMCTYCIVPFTRGRERSRPIDSIVNEIKILSDQGIKEVTLLGQNVNSYQDKSESHYYGSFDKEINTNTTVPGFSTVYKPKVGGRRFADLLDKVSLVNPEMRIRFTSPHPKDFPDPVYTVKSFLTYLYRFLVNMFSILFYVLELVKERKNICKNIHLPAQSGNNDVLAAMGRGYTRESYLDLVSHVRNVIPDVTLTSDFIAGFCGETEQAHQDTISLIKAVNYTFCYTFPYSMREKTRAHRRLVDDVPPEVKSRRHIEIRDTFRDIASADNKKFIGTKQLVLIEKTSKKSNDFWVGRNDYNIKTIVEKLPLPSNNDNSQAVPQPGDYVVVEIFEANSEVLKGKPLLRTRLSHFV